MTKKLLRLATLVLAIVMVASCVAACGNSDTASTDGSGNQGGTGEAKVTGMLPEVDPEQYRGTKVVMATRTDQIGRAHV